MAKNTNATQNGPFCGNISMSVFTHCSACSNMHCKCDAPWTGFGCETNWWDVPWFKAVFYPCTLILGFLFILAFGFNALELYRLPRENKWGLPRLTFTCGLVGCFCRAIYLLYSPPYFQPERYSPLLSTIVFGMPTICEVVSLSATIILWAELVNGNLSARMVTFPTKLRPIFVVLVNLFSVLFFPCSYLPFYTPYTYFGYVRSGMLMVYSAFVTIMNLKYGCQILKRLKKGKKKSISIARFTRFVIFLSCLFGINILVGVIYSLLGSNLWAGLVVTVYFHSAELLIFIISCNFLRKRYTNSLAEACLSCTSEKSGADLNTPLWRSG